jgi:diguanylate cyclase (GGDEF)-like protein/PAS domain S-box-containing protein
MSTTMALRVGPVGRLTLGLVAMVVSMLMAMDLLFGLVPDSASAQRELRKRFAESLAVQVASLTETGDERTLGKTLQQVVTRNREVASVAVREASGYVLAQRGDHARNWVAPETGRSTSSHVRVPINAQHEHWGDLEVAFAAPASRGIRDWLAHPMVVLLAAVVIGGFSLFYPYLRRALHMLDPSNAIPDRVRSAFDAFTGGVVVVDPQGQIVLANKAFRKILPESGDSLHGRKLSELACLHGTATREGSAAPPWETVFRDGIATDGYPLSIARPDGESLEMLVACSPISDNNGRTRGCLVMFDDVTALHRVNELLLETLADLDRSREKIEAQNEELRVLATRDPLTGCLNRRAFFAAASEVFSTRLPTNRDVSCIIADIDHFKSFNDLYGHSVGDQVIQVVARTLLRNTRNEDLVCRYGGEEFCIVLPDTTLEAAQIIAERMREDVEGHALDAIRSTRVERITASFGVASLWQGAARLEELIDQADNALYASKEAGRNRVSAWTPPDA